MARYTDIDNLIAEYDRVHVGPAGGARKLMVEAPIADVAPRADVIEEYRKKVYAKMEKYTVFGREYIQRIMREVEKEYTEGRK